MDAFAYPQGPKGNSRAAGLEETYLARRYRETMPEIY